MMRKTLLGLTLLLAGWAWCPADAQAQRLPPIFTAADEVVIERNEVLQDLRRISPRDVRRILDALAFATSKRNDDPEFHRKPARRLQRDNAAERPAFDPEKNPDLVVYQRSSPEAAHDLFQLLKQIQKK
jgi:non-ribosomal peptide synthetase component F